MKKALLYSLLALVSLGANAQNLKPMIPHVECGQLLFKTPATLTLDVKNLSNAAVTIKEVDTGCGCTTAEYSKGSIIPGNTAQVKLILDCKQLGHFNRVVRIFDSASKDPAEVMISGQVVTKVENFTGEYPNKLGVLLTDIADLEFEDINKGQRSVQEIHIMNPTGQNVQPTALRLPPYLKAEMKPEILGPKQKGTMVFTLNSQELRDYGLTQSVIYLAKDPADKVSAEKEISISAVLLPPVITKDDVSRPYAPKLSMSEKEVDMTMLQNKSKVKAEITITNDGRSNLEISKLQMFTTGLQVQLGKTKIAPGESTKLKVTGIAKDLKKVRTRPRILMITNDPDNQKVVITIKK